MAAATRAKKTETFRSIVSGSRKQKEFLCLGRELQTQERISGVFWLKVVKSDERVGPFIAVPHPGSVKTDEISLCDSHGAGENRG